jgi:peptide deformylase
MYESRSSLGEIFCINFQSTVLRNPWFNGRMDRRNYLKEHINMYLMDDITRDGDPVLRVEAQDVQFPLSAEDRKLADDMMEYLVISQDEEQNEKYKLRPGVGLAAPQVGESKRMAAILVPAEFEDEEPLFKGVISNPVIVSHSVQDGALDMGEGCLSVDEDVPAQSAERCCEQQECRTQVVNNHS